MVTVIFFTGSVFASLFPFANSTFYVIVVPLVFQEPLTCSNTCYCLLKGIIRWYNHLCYSGFPFMVSVRGAAPRITDRSPFLLTTWDFFCLPSPMLPSPSSLPLSSSMLFLLPRANGCFSDSKVWKQTKTPSKKLFLEGHVPGFYMLPLSF